MLKINGVDVPENIVNNSLFINALTIAKQWVKKGGEYYPIESGEDVNVCGVSIIKELFDNKAFRLGLIVGCSKNVVSFDNVVYVQHFTFKKINNGDDDDDDYDNTTFVGKCVTEPINFEKKPKPRPRSRPNLTRL